MFASEDIIFANCPPKVLALVFVKTAVIGSVLSDANAIPSGKRFKHVSMPYRRQAGICELLQKIKKLRV